MNQLLAGETVTSVDGAGRKWLSWVSMDPLDGLLGMQTACLGRRRGVTGTSDYPSIDGQTPEDYCIAGVRD